MAEQHLPVEAPYTTFTELASASGVAKRAIECRARRANWSYTEERPNGRLQRQFAVEQLPSDLQTALLAHRASRTRLSDDCATAFVPSSKGSSEAKPITYDRETLWQRYGELPDPQKDEAKTRLEALSAVMLLIDQGVKQRRAFEAVGEAKGLPWRTMEQWYHGTKQRPGAKHYARADWLAALAPSYSGGQRLAELADEAWEYIKADYLRLEAPALSAVYRRAQRAASERGWALPSVQTIKRRLQADVPRSVRVLKRQGEEALMRLYPPMQRTVRTLQALEAINGDGYEHNVFVRWSDGSVDRPRTWFWQDTYSRKILAYGVDQTENADLIRTSFGDVLELGIPHHVTIDNTRAAANKWMTGGVRHRYRFKVRDDDPLGIFPMFGCQVHWTSVFNGRGHGQAKPVERAFGIGGVGEVIDKHPAFAGAYTGRNPTAKPENYGEAAVPLARFMEVLTNEVIAWNKQPGRRTEMAGGVKSFDEVFDESYARSLITKGTEEQRMLCLLCAEAVTVGRDGTFSLDAGAKIGHGRAGRNRYYAAQLLEFEGQKLAVRFDPQSLHERVYAYTLDGRRICVAECVEAAGFFDTDTGRAYTRTRNQFLKATRRAAAAEVRMSAIEIAGLLPSNEPAPKPDTKLVKMFAPTPPRALSASSPEDVARFEDFVKREEARQAQPKDVRHVDQDGCSLYAYWWYLDQRVQAGEALNEHDTAHHQYFPDTPQFRSGKERLENEFGINPADYLPSWVAWKKKAG